MLHPIVRDYLRFLEQQYRGTFWNRLGLTTIIMFSVCFAILGVAVMIHEFDSGGTRLNPGGPFLPIGLVFIWYNLRRTKFKKLSALAPQAVPVWVHLVQANRRLFRPGDRNQTLPCLVVYSFEINGASKRMTEIAHRIFSLKGERQNDPDMEYVRSLVANELAVRYRRRQLPTSFVGDAIPVYVADLYILRRHLKHAMLTESCLLCLASSEIEGIELVPWQVQEGKV
jgi:hypothetical protein